MNLRTLSDRELVVLAEQDPRYMTDILLTELVHRLSPNCSVDADGSRAAPLLTDARRHYVRH